MKTAFDPRAFRLQRHIGPSMLYTLGSFDWGLNFRHLPARGILGMFMNEVLLHFHLQFVTLYASSDLWLNSLCFQFTDFSWFCTRVQRRRKVVTADFLQEVRDALDPAHVGVLPCHLQGRGLPCLRWFLQSSNPVNPSRSPNLVAHDAKFDGLSSSRCCPSAFATNTSKFSPCLFWPRLCDSDTFHFTIICVCCTCS